MQIISCSPRNRCKQWKKCLHCSSIRQAQIANIAQLGASNSRSVTYAVVRPATSDIAQQKNQILKALKNRVDGGIWTIETGKEVAGLHANLIIGSDKPIHAAEIAAAVTVEAEVYAEHIPHTDVRNVAAYASKHEAFPSHQEYKGRLYGSFGIWKKPLASVAEGRANPEVAALAVEQMLADAGIPEPVQKEKPDLQYPPMSGGREDSEKLKSRVQHNREERERVQREYKKKKREQVQGEYLKRLIAVHSGEIEINGFAYVAGYGIATQEELERFGLCKKNDHKK